MESISQSWALAHFFEVRYPLPTLFFPLDRWRSCVHFLNFFCRSSLKRSSLNQWFAERKRANSLIALYYFIIYLYIFCQTGIFVEFSLHIINLRGGYERIILCLRLIWETCRFTVPPAVALMNYMRRQVVYFGRFLAKLGLLTGFSLYTIHFAGKNSEAENIIFLASVVQWKDTLGPILWFFPVFRLISPERTAKL